MKEITSASSFIDQIRVLIEQARKQVVHSINSAMVFTYWEIGKKIIEEEQNGKDRAEYGKYLLKNLAENLKKDFGKGFDESNLRYMRLFYKVFPIRDALRHELSWTHYRLLLKVESETARKYYLNESIACAWSSRQLERQIETFYFERIVKSKNKDLLKNEVFQRNDKAVTAGDIIKDPYILEFLDLKYSFYECISMTFQYGYCLITIRFFD